MENDKEISNGDDQVKHDDNDAKGDNYADRDAGGDFNNEEFTDDLDDMSQESDVSLDIINGQPIELDDKRYEEGSDFEHYSENEYESYESGKEGVDIYSQETKEEGEEEEEKDCISESNLTLSNNDADDFKNTIESKELHKDSISIKSVEKSNSKEGVNIQVKDDIKGEDEDNKSIVDDSKLVETVDKDSDDFHNEDNSNDLVKDEDIENKDDTNASTPRSDKCGHFEEDDDIEGMESANHLDNCEVRSELGDFEEDTNKNQDRSTEDTLDHDLKRRKGITPIQYPTPEKRMRLNSDAKNKEKSEIPANDYSRHLKIVLRDAVFYLMKWENEKNMKICRERCLWMTSDLIENMINDSFKNTGNVILLFSLKGSDKFQGFARIIGGSDRSYPEIAWCDGDNHKSKKFRSIFLLDWISQGEVTFEDVKNDNKLNKDKSFKFGNDGQEIDRYCAHEVCKTFKKDESVDIHRIISATRNSRAAVPILTSNRFSSNHRSTSIRIPSLMEMSMSMRPPNSRVSTRRPPDVSKHSSEIRHRPSERHTSSSRPIITSRAPIQRSNISMRSPRESLLRKPLISRARRPISPPQRSSRRSRSPMPPPRQQRKPESMAVRPPGSRPLLSSAERLRRDATHMNPRDVLSMDSPHRRRPHKTSFIDAAVPHTRYRDEPPEESHSKSHRNDEGRRSMERKSRYSYRSSVKREKTPDRVREGYGGNLAIHYKPTAEKYMGTANMSRESRHSKPVYGANMDEYLVPSYSRIEPPIPPRYPPSHSYDVAAFTGIQGYSSNGQRSQRSTRESSKRERH